MDKREILKQHISKFVSLTDEQLDNFVSNFKEHSFYSALYNSTRALINVDCITDAEVLSISNADREKMCSEVHAIEHFFRWRTNRGYIASQRRLIAAYLGVSRETLSRLYNNHTHK